MRQQDAAHGWQHVVAVIGMPTAADIAFVMRFLQYLRHLGITVDVTKEPVDVDIPKLLRDGDVLLGGQVLVPEKQHTVFTQRFT